MTERKVEIKRDNGEKHTKKEIWRRQTLKEREMVREKQKEKKITERNVERERYGGDKSLIKRNGGEKSRNKKR